MLGGCEQQKHFLCSDFYMNNFNLNFFATEGGIVKNNMIIKSPCPDTELLSNQT